MAPEVLSAGRFRATWVQTSEPMPVAGCGAPPLLHGRRPGGLQAHCRRLRLPRCSPRHISWCRAVQGPAKSPPRLAHGAMAGLSGSTRPEVVVPVSPRRRRHLKAASACQDAPIARGQAQAPAGAELVGAAPVEPPRARYQKRKRILWRVLRIVCPLWPWRHSGGRTTPITGPNGQRP
jgi:hypothetical protein